MKKQWASMVLMLLVLVTGHVQAKQAYDPIEPVNRVIFGFNEYADMIVVKPAAQAYDYVIPNPAKRGVTNVIRNLRMPVIFFNSALQADPQNAFSAMWTFILNSTFGIAGIFDFAGAATDLRARDEDFGQTLGMWGVGQGPYLVLPLLGPSNLRDTTGRVVDFFPDPYNYLKGTEAIIVRNVLEILDIRYRTLGLIDNVYDTSFDPYATFRSAYTQRRLGLVKNTVNNAIQEGELDD